ncbi:MAG: PKD domain-containing protein [Steroidobacteraceae bacterium]|nr:PKD domain-containing protein [Steroidobacteraceae bacterium]
MTNQPVTFTGAGTTVTNGALTYAWNFGDGTTGSGAVSSHNYAVHGSYTVTLTVRDDGGLTTTATQSISLLAPPATPTVVVQPGARTPNSMVQLTASATDPQGSALTYTWDFGDGTTGTGADLSHAYSAPGNFTARATATNALGLAATSAPAAVSIAWLPIRGRPSLTLHNPWHLTGQTLFANAPFIEPNGLPYTLEFDFGDGTTATINDTYRRAHRTYAGAGTYTVRVTARSAAGENTSFPRTVEVRTPAAAPVVTANALEPFCSGPYCGAASATSYSGSGLGVWRYHNPTASDATLDVSIGNVREGLSATLVFSNGRKLPTSPPAPGTQKLAVPSHEAMQESNRRFAQSLARVSSPPGAAPATNVVHAAAPPLGATRTWREMPFSGQTYNMRVVATCTFSTGRNGVIWLDADQLQSGAISPSRGQELADTLCGPNGAYERLIAFTGQDVWGAAAASSPHLIQDTPGLLDLNIMAPGVPVSSGFSGYFAAFNMNNTTFDPTSNAALSVVLNGGVLATYGDSTTRNTLIHELKHLANFYQRSLARGVYHAQWLEETSAMLAEDLISPLTTPQSRTEARISGYASWTGGFDLIGWTHPQGQSYNMAGSFGAFLHRRYGASLDVELVTMCADTATPESSYDCIDRYIQRHGGVGFEDEFARMGASTLGFAPGSQLPTGFGYPGLVVAGAPLEPVNTWGAESPFNATPLPVTPIFGRTMQTFSRDYIDAGQTSFHRTGVVVPAGTTLLVVVSEPPPQD